jgi:hypothetical protein
VTDPPDLEALAAAHPRHPDGRFRHTHVGARFPSGTNPRDAIRAAMSVFMERDDGTNALGWWQQPGVRLFHGTGISLRVGDEVLPPSHTGVVPIVADSDPEAVYVTTQMADAVLYAARHPHPVVYEVTSTVEPVPDDVLGGDDTSWRVPSAVVRVAHVPSTAAIAAAAQLAGGTQ